MLGRLNKFVIVFLSLFLFIPVSFGVTYKMKNGTVTNPDGMSRQNVNVSTQQQSNYSKYGDDGDVIYTQAQTKDNNETENSNNDDVNVLIRHNEKILNRTPPDYKIISEYAKTHVYDPDIKKHKEAYLNKQTRIDGCNMTTYSDSNHYAIRCDNSNVGYHYDSIINDKLIQIDYFIMIDSQTEVAYVYLKKYNNGVPYWNLTDIHIYINNSDKIFLYHVSGSGHSLFRYCIKNDCYDKDGKYEKTITRIRI